jgi:hypothetical protein
VKLTDCTRGAIVAITWPHGSDSVDVDRELRGTEQLVQYTGPFGTTLKKKGVALDARGAFVRRVDPETLLPDMSALLVIENVDVIDVVAPYRVHSVSNDAGDDDRDDPLKGTVR